MVFKFSYVWTMCVSVWLPECVLFCLRMQMCVFYTSSHSPHHQTPVLAWCSDWVCLYWAVGLERVQWLSVRGAVMCVTALMWHWLWLAEWLRATALSDCFNAFNGTRSCLEKVFKNVVLCAWQKLNYKKLTRSTAADDDILCSKVTMELKDVNKGSHALCLFYYV